MIRHRAAGRVGCGRWHRCVRPTQRPASSDSTGFQHRVRHSNGCRRQSGWRHPPPVRALNPLFVFLFSFASLFYLSTTNTLARSLYFTSLYPSPSHPPFLSSLHMRTLAHCTSYKQIVGARLAAAAGAQLYGLSGPYLHPQYISAILR